MKYLKIRKNTAKAIQKQSNVLKISFKKPYNSENKIRWPII